MSVPSEVATALTPRRFSYGVPSLVVAVIAALLYTYVLWGAIGNLIDLPKLFGTVTPWWLLVIDVALPVVVFVVAFLLGRRHGTLVRSLFFLAGATVIACGTIASIGYIHTHFGVA
jgi:hypothetical protein